MTVSSSRHRDRPLDPAFGRSCPLSRSATLDLHTLRLILRVPAGMALLMLVPTLVAGETWLLPAWIALGVACAALDLALRPLTRGERGRFSSGETLATVALAWATVMLLGVLPFRIGAALDPAGGALAVFGSLTSALFESVSGFTSTGLTMVARPDELPRSIQLWRSLSEWVGGAGLALVMLTLMNPERDGGDDVYGSELSKPLEDDVRRTAREVWAIYAALTAFGIGLFALTGMPWWEALNHGMTAIATGGFSVTADSFGGYGPLTRVACMLVMLLGAISFAAYRDAFERRDPRAPLERGPVRVLLAGIVLATLLLWASRFEFETDVDPLSLPFQVVSAFATAGFSTVPLGDWHSAPLAVLILCMTIGGTSGATTGGLKTDRVLLLGRGVIWRLRRLFRPEHEGRDHVVSGDRYGGRESRLLVEGASTLIALWLFTALLGCLGLAAIMGDAWSFTQVAFEVMSAQSGVGLSVGITTAALDPAAKWLLIALMWAGRLELIAVFALLWLPLIRRRGAVDKSAGETGDGGRGSGAGDDGQERSGAGDGER